MSVERIHHVFGGIPEEYLPIEHQFIEARDTRLLAVAGELVSALQATYAVKVDATFLAFLFNEYGLVPETVE